MEAIEDVQPAVTITHRSAPEIQEVNISVRKKSHGDTPVAGDGEFPIGDSLQYSKTRPTSKTMTTKSTMTNDEDFDLADVKVQINAITPCTSPVSSRAGDLEKETLFRNSGAKRQKIEWKITPRVHFPPATEHNRLSFSPPLSGIRHKFPGSLATSSFTTECHYNIPEPVIDPTFHHRPDKTFAILQNKPTPTEPLKVWPGYGGNLYFQPFEVHSKPISYRVNSERGDRVRSRATTLRTRDMLSPEPSIAESRIYSFPPTTPSMVGSRRGKPHTSVTPKQPHQVMECGGNPSHMLFQRKMAILDKQYVLHMPRNTKLHEDWAWISGIESLGTLRLDNPLQNVQRQSTNETYSRKEVVEKVPRRFVFHETKRLKARKKRVTSADSQTTVIANYGKSRNYKRYALKKSKIHELPSLKVDVPLNQVERGQFRTVLRSPRNTALRISGKNVNDLTLTRKTPLILSSSKYAAHHEQKLPEINKKYEEVERQLLPQISHSALPSVKIRKRQQRIK